jgi:cell wall-associated NlpC family hydrolase
VAAPYRNGGSDPNGFDCSGFTQYVFAQLASHFRVKSASSIDRANRSSQPTSRQATWCSSQQPDPGVSHVAIVVGGDQFVHAPSSSGVVEWSVSARPTGRRAMSARGESAKQRGKPLFE